MLNALAGSIPAHQRIITAEEVFELNLANRDVVALQCRQPSLEGTGEVALRRLVKEALRMRPDRIVVGEVREAESLDLLIALNSGVPGMASIHANSARDAVAKICTLPLLAGENVTAQFVIPTVATAIDVVVHLAMDARGLRTVREIVAVTGRVEAGVVETASIYHWAGHASSRQASTWCRCCDLGAEGEGWDSSAACSSARECCACGCRAGRPRPAPPGSRLAGPSS